VKNIKNTQKEIKIPVKIKEVIASTDPCGTGALYSIQLSTLFKGK